MSDNKDQIDKAVVAIQKLKNDPALVDYADVIEEILAEYAESGDSELLKSILMDDYEEYPVTMEQFLSDPDYLGVYATRLYSTWKTVLIDLIDHDRGYLEVALS